MSWLSRNDYAATDKIRADMFNSLANDAQNWGGNVNGGGYQLSNVILSGTGGFQYTASPITLTQGSDSQGVINFMEGAAAPYTQRWSMGKNATAESGGNAGSDFAIVAYSDAGAVLSTPISIKRSTGLITLAAQQWSGPVNGGGQTLSNVVIPGTLADPTTTKGDLLARTASAVARVAVGTDGWVLTASSAAATGVAWAAPAATGVPVTRQVIAGAGLSGGGALSADVTLTAPTLGASGASHKAGIVPDPGATVGGTRYLREDATWAIPAGAGGGLTDPTTTLGDLIVRGAAAVTRLGVGANGQVLTADSTALQGISWKAAAGGSQTPWTSNIDGGGFALSNVGQINLKGGAKTSSSNFGVTISSNDASAPLQGFMTLYTDPTATNTRLAIQCVEQTVGFRNVTLCESGGAGCVGIGTKTPATLLYVQQSVNSALGGIAVANAASTATGFLWCDNANVTHLDGGSNGSRVVAINGAGTGSVGIGTTAPLATLHVHSGTNQNLQIGSMGWALAGAVGLNAANDANNGAVPFVLGASMFVLQGGNVGIGTTAPISKLHIDTGSLGSSIVSGVLLNGAYGAGTAGQSIDWSVNNSGFKEMRVIGTMNAGGTAGELAFYTNATVTSANGTEKMRITGAGNVGIATTAPEAALHIGGGSGAVLISQDAGALASRPAVGTTRIPGEISACAGAAYTDAGLLRLSAGGGTGVYRSYIDLSGYNSAADLQQNIVFGTACAERMRLNATGLGIGNAAPAYKLDVTGDVNCSGAFRVGGVAIGAGQANTAVIAYSASSLTLTSAYQDVPGAVLTLGAAGKYLIVGVFLFVMSAGGNANGQLVAGGSAQLNTAVAGSSGVAGTGTVASVAQQWVYQAAAGAVVKLQAAQPGGANGSYVNYPSSISAVWISP